MDRSIHGNPAFGLQLAEWYVDGPQIRTEWEQAIQGKIHALADPHAGVALEQQEIAEEIVAALQFPLAHPQVLCVLAGFGSRDEVRKALDYERRPIPPSLWSDLRTAGLIRMDAPIPIMF